MAKFTKKPTVHEAFQFRKGQAQPQKELAPLLGRHIKGTHISIGPDKDTLVVNGPDGVTHAVDGDWVVTSPDHPPAVVKPDVFKALYEPTSEANDKPVIADEANHPYEFNEYRTGEASGGDQPAASQWDKPVAEVQPVA